jgi:threonine dehydrogenase-like Zn-dependent dehydrogenase
MIAVHIERGKVSVRDVPKRRRPKGHALLRLISGGICNTDLELERGYYGFAGTPGHEFVAEVVEADSSEWIGRRVVGEINLACGKCEWCKRGLGRHCPSRTVLGIVKHPGAFQQFFTLPERNLFRVPDSVATDHAVFTEPIAAACEILDQVRIAKSKPVAVLGDGKLGLLIAQVLALHGAEVYHFGRHPDKLAVSRKAGAVTKVGPPKAGVKFDVVIEVTGSSEGLAAAVEMTNARGTIVLKSTVHDRTPVDMARIIVQEITLVGSRCGRFAPALKLLKSGRLNLDPMIDSRFPLADAPRAFERANEKGVLKVLLDG